LGPPERFSVRAADLLAEMPEAVATLEIGPGPADDTVARSIRIPAAVPAHLAGLGIGIAPAADGSVRSRLAICRSPD
jgi:hypothetical protein